MKTQTSMLIRRKPFGERLRSDWKKNQFLYLMVLPVIIYYFIFCYVPMYGAVIAFKNYIPGKGILGSDWVGFRHFVDFFTSYSFVRVLRNTFTISLASIVFGFPAPIVLALLMNELKSRRFSRVVQTITYIPHFISIVVVASMIKDFTMSTGVINDIVAFFGGERVTMLTKPGLFVPIYVISDIWQGVGWGTIIYLAAITTIDQQLYEASRMDGAGSMRQLWHVTLPGIMPTIVIMLILRMGSILSVGFEKIILLYNPSIYETADVISSYVYRKGIQERNWSYSAAVGLFNSVVNVTLLTISNYVSRKVNDTSLW